MLGWFGRRWRMAIQTQLLTADDLWELSHQVGDQKRLELVRGEILEMVPAGGEHGEVAGDIFSFIHTHVKKHQLGRVTAAETGYILFSDPSTVRAPDVGFVSSAHASERLPKGYVPFAPDLAVEVVSPGDTAGEVHEKVLEFLRAGTRLVWVLYPESRTIVVHTPEGAHTLTEEDALDGGDVLPGFSVLTGEVLPE
jgi:Uma2 family endonuclease